MALDSQIQRFEEKLIKAQGAKAAALEPHKFHLHPYKSYEDANQLAPGHIQNTTLKSM